MKVLYYCEKCGKPVYEKFGSGRFCSRACANSRRMTEEVRSNISKGLTKETECECKFCGKKFKTLTSRASHEKLCASNPHRIKNSHKTIDRSTTLQKVYTTSHEIVELDVTIEFVDKYKESHRVCEICGKSIDQAVKSVHKFSPKSLCIDHDHSTNKFRGLLCQGCNRYLGWYEQHINEINSYLSKSK